MDIHRLNRIEAAAYVAWQFTGDAADLTLAPDRQPVEFGEIFADNGADYFAVVADDQLVAVLECEFPDADLHLLLLPAPEQISDAPFATKLVAEALAFVQGQYHYHDDVVVTVAAASALREALATSGYQVVVQTGSFVQMRLGD
ncbi:hypothetical protein [Lacticaseibacillus sp. GG6-2]